MDARIVAATSLRVQRAAPRPADACAGRDDASPPGALDGEHVEDNE